MRRLGCPCPQPTSRRAPAQALRQLAMRCRPGRRPVGIHGSPSVGSSSSEAEGGLTDARTHDACYSCVQPPFKPSAISHTPAAQGQRLCQGQRHPLRHPQQGEAARPWQHACRGATATPARQFRGWCRRACVRLRVQTECSWPCQWDNLSTCKLADPLRLTIYDCQGSLVRRNGARPRAAPLQQQRRRCGHSLACSPVQREVQKATPFRRQARRCASPHPPPCSSLSRRRASTSPAPRRPA